MWSRVGPSRRRNHYIELKKKGIKVAIATNSRPKEDPVAAGDAEPVKSADAAVPVIVWEPLTWEDVERVAALEPAVEVRLEGLDDGIPDAANVQRLVGVLEGKVWLYFGTCPWAPKGATSLPPDDAELTVP